MKEYKKKQAAGPATIGDLLKEEMESKESSIKAETEAAPEEEAESSDEAETETAPEEKVKDADEAAEDDAASETEEDKE